MHRCSLRLAVRAGAIGRQQHRLGRREPLRVEQEICAHGSRSGSKAPIEAMARNHLRQRQSGARIVACRAYRSRMSRPTCTPLFAGEQPTPANRCRSTCSADLFAEASRPTVDEVLGRAGGRAGGSVTLKDATRTVRTDREAA